MALVRVTNVSGETVAINSTLGKVNAGAVVTRDLDPVELEEAGPLLDSLTAAGFVTWTVVGDSNPNDNLAQVCVGGAVVLKIEDDPSGVVDGEIGWLAVDSVNGVLYFNSAGGTAGWQVVTLTP